MRNDTDVLIVGGGPAGLVAAIAARRQGFRVMVADPSRPPHDKACGEGLMPVALAIANRLGIEFPAGAGFPFRGIRFIGPQSCAEANFAEGAGLAGVGLAIRRTLLHSLLADQAAQAGVELLWENAATGCDADGVQIGARRICPRWIVGADGERSSMRRWAGLDRFHSNKTRFGFRRHYAVEPWSSHVDIHWGDGCQFYITPVSRQEIGVALLSRDSHLRVHDALPRFPELARRLTSAPATSREQGACTSARRLRRVTKGRVALVGDASGSVDAITGDGVTLAFQQAEALAGAFAADDLNLYEAEHRRIARRPAYMGELLLMLDRCPRIRARVLRALASRPALFDDLLALHTGSLAGAIDFARMGLALGWRLACH
ncbi:MAG TPA: NAD(P)/FAD-dependent oxidoreductase [Bryobacteraceae bacterium]|jgi:flavin-dependent dehydrogenase